MSHLFWTNVNILLQRNFSTTQFRECQKEVLTCVFLFTPLGCSASGHPDAATFSSQSLSAMTRALLILDFKCKYQCSLEDWEETLKQITFKDPTSFSLTVPTRP